MPKLVCDFDTVKSVGKNLSTTAGEMKESLTGYESNIEGDLKDWNSPAKNSFITVNKTQIATSQADAEIANKLGEFILKAAESIEALDEGLASKIKI